MNLSLRIILGTALLLRTTPLLAQAPAQPAATANPCQVSTCREVPIRETLTALPLGNPHLRAIVGGFEQGGGIGAGVQVTSARTIPGVELRANALVSTKGNRRVDLDALFPNIGGTATHADVWFSYVARDTTIFLLDPASGPDVDSEFSITRKSYQGSLYRDLWTHLQGGIYAQWMHADAEVSTTATTSRLLTFGAFAHYDSRDDSVGLTRGLDLYARAASTRTPGNSATVADFGWTESELEGRAYIPLGAPTTSLLLRSRLQVKSPTDDSAGIPVYDLSWLGGRRTLRGSDSYRYRGNNLLVVSTELQHTIRALKPTRGIDVFGAADAGQTWGRSGGVVDASGNELLPGQASFTSDGWHAGIGGGLQYRHSPTLGARIEVNRGPERTLIYASLSRGF